MSNKEKASSIALIPYEKEFNKTTLTNHGTNPTKIKMLKVEGLDLFGLNTDEQNILLENLNNAFVSMDNTPLALIKLENGRSYNKNHRFLLNRIKEVENSKEIDDELKVNMLKTLQEMNQPFEDGILDGSFRYPEFYFAFYDKSIKKVTNALRNFSSFLDKAKLTNYEIDGYQMFSVFYRLQDIFSEVPPREVYEKYKNDLSKALAYSKFEYKKNYTNTYFKYIQELDYGVEDLDKEIEKLSKKKFDDANKNLKKEKMALLKKMKKELSEAIENNELILTEGNKRAIPLTGKVYQRYSVLEDFPTSVGLAWGYGIFNLPKTNVVMKISPANEIQFEKDLNKAIANIKTNVNSTKEKEQVDISRQAKDLEELEKVVNLFGAGAERFKKFSITVITYSESEKQLNALCKEQDKELKTMGMTQNPLIFEQDRGYKSTLLIPFNPLTAEFGRETNSSALALMFPFISSVVNDEKGVFISVNEMDEPVIVNFFQNLEKEKRGRTNANLLTFGTTGSGKSTFLKSLVSQNFVLNTRIIILDIEREYTGICRFFKGNWINMANGDKSRINPLQLLADVDNDDDNIPSNQSLISAHIGFLSDWFLLLYPDWENLQKTAFTNTLKEVYSIWNKKNKFKPVSEWKPEDFPIITDLIKHLENSKSVLINGRDIFTEMIFNLKADFEDMGRYSGLWNGPSTIKGLDNRMVCFDLNKLKDGSSTIFQAQFSLLASFVQNEVKKIFFETNDRTIILIDEAHVLLNERFSVSIDFIFSMVKLIRKRRGAIWLASQNPADFTSNPTIAHKTAAAIDNSAYFWIGKLSSKDQDAIQTLFKSTNGFTESQTKWLTTSENGKGITIVGNVKQQTQNEPLKMVLSNWAV